MAWPTRHETWSSPDGSRIAFTSITSAGYPNLYVMNADGTGMIRVTDDPAYDAVAAWRR